MIHKATELITRSFDEHDIKYRVEEADEASIVEAAFDVEAGPEVIARFISTDEDNDVAVRVYGLIRRVPADKRVAVLEACNTLSRKIRYYKFYLSEDSHVNVEMDLPVRIDDECLGECCFELFVRIMHILNQEYHILAEAIYSTPAPEKDDPLSLLKALRELREKPLIIDREK